MGSHHSACFAARRSSPSAAQAGLWYNSPMRKFSPATQALCAALLLACPGLGVGAESLFSAHIIEAPGQARKSLAESPAKQSRSRTAKANLALLASAREGIAEGREVRLGLNLFADAGLEAALERSEPTDHGYALTGSLADDPMSSAVLVVNGGWVAGTVWGREGRYDIHPLGEGAVELRQIDPSFQWRCGVEDGHSGHPHSSEGLGSKRTLASAAKDAPPPPPQHTEDDGSVIDLLVVYPSFAHISAGGHRAMRAIIDRDVLQANKSFRDGGVEMRLELAAAVAARSSPEVDGWLDDGKGMREMLGKARDKDDGFLDEIHVLRDRYAADLVLIHWGRAKTSCLAGSDECIAGVAGILGPLSVSRSSAFTHEVGHNMGLRHHRAKVGVRSDRGNSPFPYSHGYVGYDGFGLERFSTIMSSGVPKRIPYFSNPCQCFSDDSGVTEPAQCHSDKSWSCGKEQLRMGVLGDDPSDGEDGPADAVRSLTDTRKVVADYRPRSSRCRYELTPPPDLLPASGGKYGLAWRRVRTANGAPSATTSS